FDSSSTGHHLLELRKINIAVTVRINITDHPTAVLQRALLSKTLEHVVQFIRRNQTILVSVIRVERLAKLLAVGSDRAVLVGAAGVEVGELPSPSVSISDIIRLISSGGASEPRERRRERSSAQEILPSPLASNLLKTSFMSSVVFCFVFWFAIAKRERRFEVGSYGFSFVG
ncbi:hypothetical protein RJ641_006453, partial [Dillenia turbinata]